MSCRSRLDGYVFVYGYVYVCVSMCLCVSKCICICIGIRTRTRVRLCTCTCTCRGRCVCMCICIRICICICICICVPVNLKPAVVTKQSHAARGSRARLHGAVAAGDCRLRRGRARLPIGLAGFVQLLKRLKKQQCCFPKISWAFYQYSCISLTYKYRTYPNTRF